MGNLWQETNEKLAENNKCFNGRDFFVGGFSPSRHKISTHYRENFAVTPLEVREICHSAFRFI
jgi:hypothetical protein